MSGKASRYRATTGFLESMEQNGGSAEVMWSIKNGKRKTFLQTADGHTITAAQAARLWTKGKIAPKDFKTNLTQFVLHFTKMEGNMKLQISLMILNQNKSTATIEDDDGMDSIELCRGTKNDPKACCKNAAAILRKLADRFDSLSEYGGDECFKESTHKKVNQLR